MKSSPVTQKQLEKTLDKTLTKYQSSILEAVSAGFDEARQERSALQRDLTSLQTNVRSLTVDFHLFKTEIWAEIKSLKESVNQIITSIDAFLKRLLILEEEFVTTSALVDKIRRIFKDKFKIEISILGK